MNTGTGTAAAAPLSQRQDRSPLAQLLHALNQPLTGLQCSMEVALAAPRTVEQYRQGLRDGLELTARMRLLVDAIREVVDGQERTPGESEVLDLASVLRDTLSDLAPVAEQKRIRITVCGSAAVWAEPRRCAALLFQSLEAVISLAAVASELAITLGQDVDEPWAWLRIPWRGEKANGRFSRAELAMLVAEAGWEAMGAEWRREPTDKGETVTIRLARAVAGVKKSGGLNS